ncbi:hypothetical protein [Streptomyces avermitilis]|uniref:hypothetical protein n=1 Tax=Streptomyces avermitilis TaxID=33903 RepID=UPI0033CF2862
MDIHPTLAAYLLISGAAYAFHRLHAQHAERIAVRTYSSLLPSRRRGHSTPPPPARPDQPGTAGAVERHDHRDGGRGRLPARRRRSRTTHNER